MFLFSTDIDGTIYDGPESAQRFADFWDSLRETGSPPLLCYNTGRSLADTRNLISSTGLPDPDYIIAGVGTEMFDFVQNAMIPEWHEQLADHWNFELVRKTVEESGVEIEMQPPECQNEFKCSWFFYDKSEGEITSLGEAIREKGIRAQLIYSSKRDLDILPRMANKGNAIRWLAGRLGVAPSDVVVAGDSGNDSSMFGVENAFGIVVSNAESALRSAVADTHHHASKPCADGVIEGINHRISSSFPDIPNTPET